jgi:hypothetical protein
MSKETPEQLAQRLQSLEEFISLLPPYFSDLTESDTYHISELVKACARHLTLQSIVEEIAQHLGISSENFQRQVEIRTRFYHDYLLHLAFRDWPELVKKIDDRPLNAAKPDSFPPMFTK